MPQRDTSGIGERVPRELIEADFEVAFSLVEMAQSENKQLASQLLGKADGMLNDIRARLERMTPPQKAVFEKRCEELSRAIEVAGLPGFGISGESET